MVNFLADVDGQGFYLNTANTASSPAKFTIGLTTTVPGLDVTARLSRLKFHVTDESGNDGENITLNLGSFFSGFARPVLRKGAEYRSRSSP